MLTPKICNLKINPENGVAYKAKHVINPMSSLTIYLDRIFHKIYFFGKCGFACQIFASYLVV